MTLRLILVRHAKSDWDDPFLDDHDRPLNPRGQRSAKAIGGWLRQHGYLPDQAIVSTALRTAQTWELMGLDAPVRFTAGLYHASAAAMMDLLIRATGQSVLMLGHNPGIGEFAGRLVARPPRHDGFAPYPTCATLIAEFDAASWSQIGWGQGRAADFIVPRDLE